MGLTSSLSEGNSSLICLILSLSTEVYGSYKKRKREGKEGEEKKSTIVYGLSARLVHPPEGTQRRWVRTDPTFKGASWGNGGGHRTSRREPGFGWETKESRPESGPSPKGSSGTLPNKRRHGTTVFTNERNSKKL